MKKRKLDSGHIVYKLSKLDREKLLHGPICDMCNESLSFYSIYIPVLSKEVCISCYRNWKANAIYYREDAWFEKENCKRIENNIKENRTYEDW